MRYRAWAVLGLLLLGLSGSVGEAAPPDRVPPGVRHRVQTEGSARVLVRLHLPGGAYVTEGQLSAAGVSRQRRDVATTQSQLVSRLRGKRHAVLGQFETVPLLALEVGPDALAELEAAFSVDVIAEDRLRVPQLSDSVPLIGGDLAWANGFTGAGTVVAVLDTGVERQHAFLTGKVVEEACYSSNITGQSRTVCPNGQTSQTGTNSARPCSLDGCFHGTHVAGIVAGNGAGAGVAFSGVAKGAQLMAIQVFSRITSAALCGGVAPCLGAWESDIIKGLERVYQRAHGPEFRRRQPEPGRGPVHGALRHRRPQADHRQPAGGGDRDHRGLRERRRDGRHRGPGLRAHRDQRGVHRTERRGLVVLERRAVPDPVRPGGIDHLGARRAAVSSRPTAPRRRRLTSPARGPS